MHEKEMKVFLTMVGVFVTLAVGCFVFFWVSSSFSLATFSQPFTPVVHRVQNIKQKIVQALNPEPLELKTASKPSTLATQPTASPAVLGVSQTRSTQFEVDKLYALINGYRRDNKLAPLKIHTILEQTAQAKLSDMLARSYWTHKDPEGRESWYLFEQAGYHFEKAGENISTGYTTAWQVFSHWQASPEHNAQLLTAEYEHMGAAADCQNYSQSKKKSCVVVLHLGKQLL